MNWLKEIIKKIFFKNKTKLLNEPKQIINNEREENKFFVDLKRQTEVELDDGNGYKIVSQLNLREMV